VIRKASAPAPPAPMTVDLSAGLEAAEEVFLTLDSQQQLEAFVSDGEAVEAGKVIARMIGFADVLISAERVALNLLQHLSGIATLTNNYVKAVDGTGAQITDTRATTPGLRPLERYAVELGGGYNSRFGLDDGVMVTSNHISILGGVSGAVKSAKEKLGYLHKVAVEVSNENEVREAVAAGAHDSKPSVVSDQSFDRDVIQERGRPVLVDAWAPWCGPCRMIAPLVEELAAENQGSIKVCKINVDDSPQAAQEFGVSSIPTAKRGTSACSFSAANRCSAKAATSGMPSQVA